MSNLIPIANLPLIYANSCAGAWLSTTTYTVSAGQVRDSTNTYDIVVPATLTINGAANGANALDTGSLANNTMYAVYVCFDPTARLAPCALLSASLTVPVLPTVNGITYSAFRLLDYVLTDGSAHFLKAYNVGSGGSRYKQYDAPIAVLTNGAATSFTAVDLSVAVPVSGFGKVKLLATYTPHAAGDFASLQPTGATATAMTIYGIVASVVQTSVFDILPLIASAKPEVSYEVSSATSPAAFSLSVIGYDFNI